MTPTQRWRENLKKDPVAWEAYLKKKREAGKKRYEEKREQLLLEQKEYRNREDVKARMKGYMADWYAKKKHDPEYKQKASQSSKRWRDENIERCLEVSKQWREANRETARQLSSDWAKRNKGRRAASVRKRQAALLNRTPDWVTSQSLASYYEEASRLTNETGIPHEVDHIVPLQGKTVSGLHVPWNLRVVTRHENRTKSNRTEGVLP